MFAFDGGAGRGAATTKQVTRTDGTLEFVSYDEKIVLDCQQNALDKNTTTTTTTTTTSGGSSSTSGSVSSTAGNNSTNSTGDSCSITVAVGLYYNDVWEYDLNCTRYTYMIRVLVAYVLFLTIHHSVRK